MLLSKQNEITFKAHILRADVYRGNQIHDLAVTNIMLLFKQQEFSAGSLKNAFDWDNSKPI